MTLAPIGTQVSASDIATYEDCAARYYHSKQGYGADVLHTDRVAAAVSSAVHDAAMMHNRQIEQDLRRGTPPSHAAGRTRLRTLVDQFLRRNRLESTDAAVAERLGKLWAGIDRAADLILDDAPQWARNPRTGDPLVWVEAALDHGPTVRAVELCPGFLVRTRPDLIGLRLAGPDHYYLLVRDFKGRGDAIDPAFDTGILIRAIWVMLELQDHRCRWFLPARDLPVDSGGVDLETVNLMFADDERFLMRASLTEEQLMAHRDRLVETMKAMMDTLASERADEVLASPGGLCLNWCPFLKRCEAGMAHTRKYHGEDVLLTRLAGS